MVRGDVFGFAVVLAAAALAGAPATPVRCNPAMPTTLQGATRYTDGNSAALLIEVNTQPCAGLVLLAASPTERAKIAALNPGVNFAAREGLAASVILLEEVHATHAFQQDETDDLCRTQSLLPAFLGRYLTGDELTAAEGWAGFYATLLDPAVYRTHPC